MRPSAAGDAVHTMYEQPRFGSDGFVRFMRTLSALAILVAIGGAFVLFREATEEAEAPAIELTAGYGPGVVLLEPADVVGPDPFTAPVAVDLGLDQTLMAYPPLSTEAFAGPNRFASEADLLMAGEFGWALVERRDAVGGRLTMDEIREVALSTLGLNVTLSDLDDVNGDGYDDDGTFTLEASDGSAVCVSPGAQRTLAEAQGLQIDVEDDAAVHGLTWEWTGPCGTPVSPRELNRVETGATPGVFGGTALGDVCDVGLLVSSLEANPRAAEAWATVHGITPESISDFASALTPVVLLKDTAVTSFGWRDGALASRQSVLQRGTSVLVDRRGIPAARCLSGAPLRPPQPMPAAPSFQGGTWAGFSRAYVDEVLSADRDVLDFVLVDIVTGDPISRPPGVPGSLASLAGPIYVVEG